MIMVMSSYISGVLLACVLATEQEMMITKSSVLLLKIVLACQTWRIGNLQCFARQFEDPLGIAGWVLTRLEIQKILYTLNKKHWINQDRGPLHFFVCNPPMHSNLLHAQREMTENEIAFWINLANTPKTNKQ